MSSFRRLLKTVITIVGDIVNGLDSDLYFNNNLTDQLGHTVNPTGTITYTIGQNGAVNTAVLLDGLTSFLTYADSSVGAYTTSDFTISWWVFPISLANAPVIIFKGEYGTTGFYMQVGGDGSGFMAQNVGGGANSIVNLPTGAITAGVWNYLTLTKTGTGGNATYDFYVNTVNVSHVINAQDLLAGGYPLTIGTYNANTSLCLNGAVDDFRLYNRALSTSEISTLYKNGAK